MGIRERSKETKDKRGEQYARVLKNMHFGALAFVNKEDKGEIDPLVYLTGMRLIAEQGEISQDAIKAALDIAISALEKK